MTAGEKEPGPGLAKRMLFETRPEQAIAILAHEIQVLVLIADGLFRCLGNPEGEENHPVHLAPGCIHCKADCRPRRLVPRNNENMIRQRNNEDLLIFHPASTHHPTMNTIITGMGIVNIEL